MGGKGRMGYRGNRARFKPFVADDAVACLLVVLLLGSNQNTVSMQACFALLTGAIWVFLLMWLALSSVRFVETPESGDYYYSEIEEEYTETPPKV